MKRLLLTGIGGSIGIHTFAHIMHNTDWHVVGIDSFRHKGLVDRIKVTLDDHPDWADRLTMVTHDLTAPFSELTTAKLGEIDYIISMASLSDVWDSIQDPVPFVRNNVDIALNVLELARVLKPESFIQISTDETSGPTPTGYRHPEWAATIPSNPYSASKAAQEALAVAYWRTYQVPVIITNTMNNVGEMQQGNKFPVIVQKMVERGESVPIHGEPGNIGTRYYLHSRNHSDALLFILQNVKPHMHEEGAIDRPDRFNIVGDVELDNLELAQMIADKMGKPLKHHFVGASDSRPGHDQKYGLDGGKLAALGWEAPVDFEESLENVIEWQTEHPEWMDV